MKTDLTRFDREQRQAITELSGRNIIVSASAGSGKTSVLVARILKRCIDDRVPLRRILALTFTKAAAEEMKNRLAKELNRYYTAAKQEGRTEDVRYLNQQIIDLVSADITTIDSYCMTVIQKYYNTIGMDPAMTANIITEGIDSLYEKDAFYAAVRAMYARDPEKAVEFFEYFSIRSIDYEDTVFQNYVHPVNAYAAALIDPDTWYDSLRTMMQEVHSLQEYPAVLRDSFFRYLQEYCKTIRDNALILNGCKRTPKFTDEDADRLVDTAQDALQYAKEQDYEGLCSLIPSFIASKTPMQRDDVTKAARKAWNDAADSLLSVLYNEEVFTVDSALHTEIWQMLIDLCIECRDRYQAIKKKYTAMTYADMERFTLDILDEARPAASILRDTFDEILVDEFQDTSFLQNEIIERISNGTNVFRVGDIKQSIYRFRQARPQLMQDLIRSAHLDPQSSIHISLCHNYRSQHSIVAFANHFFERLMSADGLHYPFTDADRSAIGETADSHARQTSDCYPVTCLLAGDADDKLNKAEEQEQVASAIASKILQIRETEGINWQKFAVLVRGRHQKRVLKKVFDQYGIPYDIDAREGFYQSDLCQLILSVAKVIRNPYDDISWMAVLTSPMYECSDQAIAEMVLRLRDALSQLDRPGCTVQDVRTALGLPEGEYGTQTVRRSLSSAVTVFRPEIPQLLAGLKDTALGEGIPAMLSKWINMACAPSADPSAPDILYDRLSPQSRANFNYLFDTFLNTGINDLEQFIRVIEESTDELSSEAVSVGKDDDVVQVTTIHGSKGLQYDTVFLFGTGTSVHPRSRGVVIDDTYGFAIPDMDPDYRVKLPTIPSILIKENNEREEIEEFIRLYYVAVTRAVRRLYLVEYDIPAEKVPCVFPVTLDTLREYQGGTGGLFFCALDHEPFPDPLTGKLLYQAEHAVIRKPELIQKKAGSVTFPRFTQERRILPEMITPSSLERPHMEPASVRFLPPLFFGANRGTAYGTMMHALTEALPDDREWTEDLVRAAADTLGCTDSLTPRATADLLDFGHSDLYQQCRTMQIHKEYPFYSETDGRMNGSIDFAAIGEDRIILIDFKTDNKTPAEILDFYKDQLNAYRKVLHTAWPDKQIDAYAWSFHNRCAIVIPG